MTRRIISTFAAVLVASACAASKPQPIPISADPATLQAMVGKWSGEYSSEATGRSGSIVFNLSAGKDTAYGDVVMVPRTNVTAQGADRVPIANATPSSEVLTIHFARAEGDMVSGRLNPYTDPACGCVVQTTFVGRLTDPNTIEGTFTTTGALASAAQSGRWRVKRQ